MNATAPAPGVAHRRRAAGAASSARAAPQHTRAPRPSTRRVAPAPALLQSRGGALRRAHALYPLRRCREFGRFRRLRPGAGLEAVSARGSTAHAEMARIDNLRPHLRSSHCATSRECFYFTAKPRHRWTTQHIAGSVQPLYAYTLFEVVHYGSAGQPRCPGVSVAARRNRRATSSSAPMPLASLRRCAEGRHQGMQRKLNEIALRRRCNRGLHDLLLMRIGGDLAGSPRFSGCCREIMPFGLADRPRFTACAPGIYGADCSGVCACGPEQDCNDGVGGDGRCTSRVVDDDSSAVGLFAFENFTLRRLRVDHDRRRTVRQVKNASVSRVRPTAWVGTPRVLATNAQTARLLRLPAGAAGLPEFAAVLSGARVPRGATPRARVRRPPVWELGGAARRRPLHLAGRAPRRRRAQFERVCVGGGAQGLGAHAVLARRRRPRCAAERVPRAPRRRRARRDRRAGGALARRPRQRRRRRRGDARRVVHRAAAEAARGDRRARRAHLPPLRQRAARREETGPRRRRRRRSPRAAHPRRRGGDRRRRRRRRRRRGAAAARRHARAASLRAAPRRRARRRRRRRPTTARCCAACSSVRRRGRAR